MVRMTALNFVSAGILQCPEGQWKRFEEQTDFGQLTELQLNIFQRQAKNELEVLSEQLEKLEKQTQYTTGGQITNCK